MNRPTNGRGPRRRATTEYITNERATTVQDDAQPVDCASLSAVRELRQLGVGLLQLADKVEAFALDPDDAHEVCT
jgi:hypothetical protein